MMVRFPAMLVFAVLAAGWLPRCAAAAGPGAEPLGVTAPPVVPQGLGVNIHFTDPRPGEMKMLAGAGFTWVRMDFAWNATEREKGKYDFSAYDRLLAALDQHKIRALLILDYHNRFYDDGLSPRSDEGRKAMARWAAAAARRFQGRGVLWEMYNEPNIFFWKPKPNVRDYTLLALEVGKALREAAPQEMYIGPATSQIDFGFLEECFKAGLLEYWCAVSVHPYRQTSPETAAPEYARLRRLIGQYAPKGKRIPILSGEWGYSAAWGKYDEVRQGKYLPRQWLVNLANDVPISIWYDWHDDGRDPKEPEHHFGTVKHEYFKDREPVYDPKPAYRAAKTLTAQLGGFSYSKRLPVGEADDHVLLFRKGKDVRLAVWTAAREPRKVAIPASPGKFLVTGHTGESLAPVQADAQGLSLTLTDAPQYLAPEGANELLQVAAAWQRAPCEVALPAQRGATVSLRLQNPLARPMRVTPAGGDPIEVPPGGERAVPVRFDLSRAEGPVEVRVELTVEGLGRMCQHFLARPVNPLRVTVLPAGGKAIWVRVEDPSGEGFRGTVRLAAAEKIAPAAERTPLELRPGEKEKSLAVALAGPAPAEYRFGVEIADEAGEAQLATPPVTYRAVDDLGRYTGETLGAAYQLAVDGDAAVRSRQSMSLASPPEGPPAPGTSCVKIEYDFDEGWKFVRVAPRSEGVKTVPGRPKALSMCLWGDGSGNYARVRVVDATGQCHQFDVEPLAWRGWRQVSFRLDGEHGHWGGADDGRIHWPIRLDTLLLVDSAGRRKTSGEVYFAGPAWTE